MTHYRYKNRKQPENRKHLGELETNKECKERLRKIKTENANIEMLKKEVCAQTGSEFYFAMHKKEEKCKNYKKEIQYIEWEMRRMRKKMNEQSKGIHIKFDDDDIQKEEKTESETTAKIKKYIDDLQSAKEEYKTK